ncbi:MULTISPECIES: DUF3006 domain-containing protein [Alteribacter]|uniref:DUF3006 domain-containing protein n=1 Tax=Alteribacter keqinensis TaxID=2483800 RepID=A0A3M7TZ00_9BACI|nr:MULTISPECIES: DUF3006 domain-containing protein [Alteribacter]MBM7096261.1 DUF3006 domain-containing protein [Alteribacter salitolerans]RNA70511.1 DUF3006 domain-containing protein [Alteribacter keqinensis]
MGKKQAVLDRIEDGQWAVLLVGEEEKEVILPIQKVPPKSKEGDWFIVTFVEDTVSSVVLDEEKTTSMQSSIQSKLQQLKKKKQSRYKNEK